MPGVLTPETPSNGSTAHSVTCSGCPATWTGLSRCHCAACHRTFGSVGLFDRHRSQAGDRGTCLDPAGLRHRKTGEPLMRLVDGLWRGPELPADAYTR